MMQILIILWTHFVADFLLQTDKMALNKSSSFKWLGLHSSIYSLPFILVVGWEFAFITLLLHFIVDGITSRITKSLWVEGERHWFFVVIGLDQVIHTTLLIWTLKLIGGI